MEYTLRRTKVFDKWLSKKLDNTERTQVLARLERAKNGNFGDVESVGSNIYELRFHSGSGLRVYYTKIGEIVILLLCGGNKTSQSEDIVKAKKLLKKLEV